MLCAQVPEVFSFLSDPTIRKLLMPTAYVHQTVDFQLMKAILWFSFTLCCTIPLYTIFINVKLTFLQVNPVNDGMVIFANSVHKHSLLVLWHVKCGCGSGDETMGRRQMLACAASTSSSFECWLYQLGKFAVQRSALANYEKGLQNCELNPGRRSNQDVEKEHMLLCALSWIQTHHHGSSSMCNDGFSGHRNTSTCRMSTQTTGTWQESSCVISATQSSFDVCPLTLVISFGHTSNCSASAKL